MIVQRILPRSKKLILWFKQTSKKDVSLVGGKNSSLGEMISQLSKSGINIPNGFSITTTAYGSFLKANKLDQKLKRVFNGFRPKNINSLRATGRQARNLILEAEFPAGLKKEIIRAYGKLSKLSGSENLDVAVRSSGVAEDAPNASFAGQFETFLNISGSKELLLAVKKCLASNFNDRLIAYREEKGFEQLKFAVSIGVQKMVRSDLGSAGVLFTIDTETGFSNVILINSIFGVGEMIVKGKVTPDEFYVFKPALEKGFESIIVKNLGRKNKKYIYNVRGGLKEARVPEAKQARFSLTDDEVITLAKWGQIIEKHYGKPQDIEWAKDGKTGELFIVQSRPETVHTSKKKSYEEYQIKTTKKPILKGIAIGDKIGQGKVRIVSSVSKAAQLRQGEVLVTSMTDPDWLPIMRKASAIITDEGGKTCHSAIVARELGIPAIVGTENATKLLKNGKSVTVDCTQGLDGRVFEGEVDFEVKKYDLKKFPKLKTKIMLNIGAPEMAFQNSFLPNSGVGLARMEFILAEKIRVHPLALYHYNQIKDEKIVSEIDKLTVEHKNKKEFFIKELAEGISQIAAAFYPKEVIVRMSDLRTNEYRDLIGGGLFEEEEANPMLGFRGAARYLDKEFQPAFKMECSAIKRARDKFGLTNISLMVPFCRTVEEGEQVIELMKKFGLKRTEENKLKIYVMCELPSNVILAEEFSEIFDSYSVGSNDLTQLLLGVDRDNGRMAHIFDENNEAVKRSIKDFIEKAHRCKKKVGICGEAPATVSGFAEFLIRAGIDSISVNPSSIIKTILLAGKTEKKLMAGKIEKKLRNKK